MSFADVLRPAVPVVMGVVPLAGDEPAQELGEVFEGATLELVHPDAAGH